MRTGQWNLRRSKRIRDYAKNNSSPVPPAPVLVNVMYNMPHKWKLQRFKLMLERLSFDDCKSLSVMSEDKYKILVAIDHNKSSRLVSPLAAAAFLEWNRYNGQPEVSCINRPQGCTFRTYWRIVVLHEATCSYPRVKRISCRNVVEASLNVTHAPVLFGAFCRSFLTDSDVLLLYRQVDNVLKIRLMHYSGTPKAFKYGSLMIFRFASESYILYA